MTKINKSIENKIVEITDEFLEKEKIKYVHEPTKEKLREKNFYSFISKALEEYESKSGGNGGNIPDFIIQFDNMDKPTIALIECKGTVGKLSDTDNNEVTNFIVRKDKQNKVIQNYAMNGAIHYAMAIKEYYNKNKDKDKDLKNGCEIIAIGINGHKDFTSKNNEELEIGVSYLNTFTDYDKYNFKLYKNLNFLKQGKSDSIILKKDLKHFDRFLNDIRKLNLTPQILEQERIDRELEIQKSLQKIHQFLFDAIEDIKLDSLTKLELFIACIIASHGIKKDNGDYEIDPLDISSLKVSEIDGARDGDKVLAYVNGFFQKHKESRKNSESIEIHNGIKSTLGNDKINSKVKFSVKVSEKLSELDINVNDDYSYIKLLYKLVKDNLSKFYDDEITTDLTGALYKEIVGWFKNNNDKKHNIVLTPTYISKFMVKLAKVNQDSLVWDVTAGSGGLLINAMNEMINNVYEENTDFDVIDKRIENIKYHQLLGYDNDSLMYNLSLLNMILCDAGLDNVQNINSNVNEIEIKKELYKYEPKNKEKKNQKPNVLLINPPYNGYDGNGMIFIQNALKAMDSGRAVVIIQSSTGSSNKPKTKEINTKILENNTLVASIKMHKDTFIGQSNVQTHIYVFKVGEKHDKDDQVRFVTIPNNDGYYRANRSKSTADKNFRDEGNGEQLYNEIIKFVNQGFENFEFLSKECVTISYIDPRKGNDWNQNPYIPKELDNSDFSNTVKQYLSWKISDYISDLDEEDLIKK